MPRRLRLLRWTSHALNSYLPPISPARCCMRWRRALRRRPALTSHNPALGGRPLLPLSHWTPPRADQPAAGWAAAAQAAATVCGPCMWLACGACHAECARTPTSPAPPEQRSLFQAVSQARCMPDAAARYAAAKAAALREPRRAHKSQDLRRPAARGKRRSPRPPSARAVHEAAAGADVRRGLLRISGGTGRSGVLILTCVTAHAPAFVRGARAGKRSASTGGAPAAARGALKSASGAATGLRAAQPTRRAAPAF